MWLFIGIYLSHFGIGLFSGIHLSLLSRNIQVLLQKINLFYYLLLSYYPLGCLLICRICTTLPFRTYCLPRQIWILGHFWFYGFQIKDWRELYSVSSTVNGIHFCCFIFSLIQQILILYKLHSKDWSRHWNSR